MGFRAALVVVGAMLLGPRVAAAQIGDTLSFSSDSDAATAPPYGVFLRTRVGRATAPFFTEALPTAQSEFTQAISFVFGGHFAASPNLSVGARVAAAPSVVMQPAGSYIDEKTWGNPELFAQMPGPAFSLGPFRGASAFRIALGVPLAGHDRRLSRNRVVAVSDAMEGWRNAELHTPGVLPVTATYTSTLVDGDWHLQGAAKLPVMFRINDADLPEESATRAVSSVPHVSLGATYWATPWFAASALTYLAVQAPAPVAHDRGAVQLGLEPGVRFVICDSLAIALDASVPLGGPLADTLGFGIGVAWVGR